MTIRLLSILFLIGILPVSMQAQDDAFAEKLMLAIINNDVASIEKHQPTTEVVKEMVPEIKEKMSDDDIKNQLLIPLQQRFQANVDNVQSEIKEESIDVSKIQYKKFYIETVEGNNESMPLAMSITFDYKGKEEAIPLTIKEINGEWYVFEILMSTNIFKEN